ncbi:hypothetical protein GCM10027592_47120 [Spirosoma flavus]
MFAQPDDLLNLHKISLQEVSRAAVVPDGFRNGLGFRLIIMVMYNDRTPFPGQAKGDGFTDAPRGSRDEGSFSG